MPGFLVMVKQYFVLMSDKIYIVTFKLKDKKKKKKK